MPDLSTLTTVITADVSGFTAGVSKVVSDAEKLRSSVNSSISGGLGGIGDQIKQMGDKILSFQGILRIGLGGQVMREIFHGIHAGAREFVTGIVDAQRAGEDFFQSTDDGIRKLLGLQTRFEEAAKAAERFAESQKSIKEATGKINKITGANTVEDTFPFLPEGKSAEADAALASLLEQRGKAAEDLKAAYDKKPTADRGFLTNFQYNLTHLLGDLGFDQSGNNALDIAEATKHQSDIDATFARYKQIDDQISRRRAELFGKSGAAASDKALGVLTNWQSNLSNLGKDIVTPFEKMGDKLSGAFSKEFAADAKKRAEEGQKIYDETRSPLERHANAMLKLDEMLENGTINGDLYARRKQQLDQEYEKESGFNQTQSRRPSQRGGVEGAVEFARQLQDSILGKDPPTGTKQDEQTKALQQIDEDLKAATSVEFMFA